MELKRIVFVVWIGLASFVSALAQFSNPPEIDSMENHRVGSGFSIVKNKYRTFNFSPYVTVRYLNQKRLEASGMQVNKKLQLYTTGSYMNGEYGKPSEITIGLNWHPLKSRIVRINPEVLFEDYSPVGYSSYPTVIGSKGIIFMINV